MKYNGKVMKWLPVYATTLIYGMISGTMVAAEIEQYREDRFLDLLKGILGNGYGILLALEPGDATRYSVLLSPTQDGFVLTTTNGNMIAPVIREWGKPGLNVAQDFQNNWANELLHWWADCLAAQALQPGSV